MGPGEVFIALIVIGLPIMALTAIFTRWLKLKEKKFELEAGQAAEKAAQYATNNAELVQRVRVLEQIVTDGGMQTAAQIEALRAPPVGAKRDLSRLQQTAVAAPFDKQEQT